MAAAEAIAKLAKEPIPEVVLKAYGKSADELKFGKDYIIPTAFDPRLIHVVSKAVAKAAIDSGVAKTVITDWDQYDKELTQRGSRILE